MIDSFCKRVDLKNTKAESHVFSSYNLWYGYRYTHATDGGTGMYRIGDRLEYAKHKYDVLVSDMDIIMPAWPGSFASHGDDAGILVSGSAQDSNGTGIPFPVAVSASNQYTQSLWVSRNPERGLLDTQYLSTAGDVRRYDKVRWDESYDDNPRFGRVGLVTTYSQAQTAGWTVHLPLK